MMPREQGFSLVETLVALGVVAVMMALLYDSVGTQMLIGRNLAHRREAILLARSLLDQAAAGQVTDTGSWEALAWRVERRSAERGARASGPPVERLRVDVLDRATGRHLADVETLRLKR